MSDACLMFRPRSVAAWCCVPLEYSLGDWIPAGTLNIPQGSAWSWRSLWSPATRKWVCTQRDSRLCLSVQTHMQSIMHIVIFKYTEVSATLLSQQSDPRLVSFSLFFHPVVLNMSQVKMLIRKHQIKQRLYVTVNHLGWNFSVLFPLISESLN